MSCVNCDTCKPISNDCFCTFAPITGVTLESIQSSVHLAAEHFNSLINECFDICDVSDEEKADINIIKNNKKFKLFFSRLLYNYWLCDYGSGASTANGVVYKLGDGLTGDFEVSRDTSKKQIKQGSILAGLEQKFLKWFKEQFPDCIPCQETKKISCGCNVNPCGCGQTKQHQIIQHSQSYSDDDMIPI